MSYPYKTPKSTETPSRTFYPPQPSAYRPSRMQVGFPRPEPEDPTRPSATRAPQSTQHRPTTNMQLIPSIPPSSSSISQRPRPAATRTAAAPPTSGKSLIIRPGEPHHFGTSVDVQRGEVLCTLCWCRDPMSHGDAYTMLNSPRGYGIDGKPIDWQTAKMRMLDFHGKDQISHQEEVEAAPHVYDRQTAMGWMENERGVREDVRAGRGVRIDTVNNNVSWHTEGGKGRSRIER